MDMMRFHDLYLRLYTEDLQANGKELLDQFFALWSEAEESGIDLDSLNEEADDCFHRIAETRLFPLAVCKWVGELGHKGISRPLLHHVSVRYLQHSELLRFLLPEEAEQSALKAASRMCVMSVPVPVSLGWILSLNEELPASSRLTSITRMVVGLLTSEYPGTCMRLLKSEKSPFAQSRVAQEALQRLVAADATLDNLPYLTELEMPPAMERSFRYLRRDESRSVTDQAHEHALFGTVTAKHFKYATRIAMEYVGNDEAGDMTIPMFTHEMSFELPQTWVADPLRYALMMNALWNGSDE
ncbi:hypothetical protein JET76_27815 [Pseudomonas putida]|uniref:hypothetical protein n=1 Tax=Pseudomonas TaxID=286 RepID=UPI0007610715|nr:MULTISPECIES: hypothetical protein [Pseudomonas]MBI6945120.1 hypothetical protein [Pseudomonas putida]MBI6961432.1 hypothetical protein [Pseudomonas putida]MCF3157343.1 hypothetical protein [Pseudomonas juntendi]WAB95614.1 hypothetical protein OSW16_13590 [Pseudomonas putida]GLO56910.1 hypothetical protein PPUJ20066_29460 [Pseudomonas putida]